MSEPFYEVASIDYPIIDSDAHVNEPPELWQERVPARLRTRAPKVIHGPDGDVWSFDDGKKLRPLGLTATAGLSYLQFRASGMRYDEIRPGSFDTAGRACATSTPTGCTPRSSIRASRWRAPGPTPTIASCSAPACAPTTSGCWNSARRPAGRLVPQAIMPTTGIDDAVAELEWAIKNGHRGALIATFPGGGYEPTAEDARFWAIAEAAEFPLGIHIGSFSESGLQPRSPRAPSASSPTPAGRRREPTRSRPPPRCCSRARASASRACAS